MWFEVRFWSIFLIEEWMIASFLLPSSYRWSPVQRLITNMTKTNPWREPSWLLSCLPILFCFVFMAIPWGRRDRDRERKGGERGRSKVWFDERVSEWARARSDERTALALWLTTARQPTAARVNMRCGFWRDLSPIGAKWASFPGLSCTWNGLREEILPILAATIRPPPSLQLYFQI